MKCEWCKVESTKTRSNRNNTRFCSNECYKNFRKTAKYNEYLKDNSIAWGQQHMRNYKKFFLLEQNNCCAICGMLDTWNNSELVFVLDHIDGNADNNNRDNLRLVCPNCDSQLDTFKSKNKNSARVRYRNITNMEPTIGNSSSGGNNIGEVLTSKVDDNTEGIEETLARRD